MREETVGEMLNRFGVRSPTMTYRRYENAQIDQNSGVRSQQHCLVVVDQTVTAVCCVGANLVVGQVVHRAGRVAHHRAAQKDQDQHVGNRCGDDRCQGSLRNGRAWI